MKMTKKKWMLAAGLLFVGHELYQYNQPKVWGDSSDEPYIAIKGKKPADATIDAWVIFGSSGQDCKAKTFSASNGWSSGADVKWHITHNFSTDPKQYELRIPYQGYRDSLDCDVTLGDITVQAYNRFDSVGFAQLRIYQAGDDYDNKPIAINSKVTAKDCDAFIHKWKDNTFSGGLGCYLFVNEKKISKEPNYNAETVYFDFSQFNDDTVIHYDIIAGKNYRSEPLDPKTGK
ncbi:hypothetical protein [Vibrio diazotrophicus]|uniref:hypothetical protein n=1 Tax=Vibrio diazotrophicus TaxID=685 RepID=UPI00142DBBD9|nr:hypothetical protein [Vibrio diazotrophicus]NIY91407.1 hypothetical protein [Vibrio diazotrophicus]